jgi:predicted DNA-binding protein (UPF0251 family)
MVDPRLTGGGLQWNPDIPSPPMPRPDPAEASLTSGELEALRLEQAGLIDRAIARSIGVAWSVARARVDGARKKLARPRSQQDPPRHLTR